MPISVRTLAVPKAGHSADEYEDAFGVSDSETFPFRAAVADGATESAYSGGWARALVSGFVAAGGLVEAAASARARWSPPPDARWYVRAKAAEGAHAALLGVELDRRSWRAESVGDCCLFHLRGGQIYESWPFGDAGEIHYRPVLIASRDPLPEDRVARAAGTWRDGDTFILASDALAAWLLRYGPGELLAARDLHGLISGARAAHESVPLRNDDVTAIVLHPTL